MSDSKFGNYDGGHGSSFPVYHNDFDESPTAEHQGYDLERSQAEAEQANAEFDKGAP